MAVRETRLCMAEVRFCSAEALSGRGFPPSLYLVPLAAFLPGILGMEMGRPGRYHIHRQGPMRPMLRGVQQHDGHLENFLQVYLVTVKSEFLNLLYFNCSQIQLDY